MRTSRRVLITIALGFVVLILGVGLGSVWLPPSQILRILGSKLFGTAVPADVPSASVSILWNLRLPRALLAFLVGGALSVSGAVMQSVLKNPLASSYTLGVSSGASLGAGFVILYGITLPLLSAFSLPIFGFLFGMGTILLVMAATARLDGSMENNTIILVGMVFSLFANALTALMAAFARDQMQRLIIWQMGSFSMRDWSTLAILTPIAIVGTLVILHYHREMDMMTFGEEQATAMGVNLKSTKRVLLICAAALTGCTVAFVGIIGFVDLIAPHVVRRLFGSRHRLVVPMSALTGGLFMVLCDLVARTVASPQEIPVGVVTALIGGPFFAWVYFKRRKRSRA